MLKADTRILSMIRQGASAVLVMAVAVGLAGCQPQEQQPEAAAVDTAEVIDALDQFRAAYEEALATNNFERLDTLLTDNARRLQAGGGQWDTLRAPPDQPFPPGATLDITPNEVQVLGPNWAYEYGTATLTYTPAGEVEPNTVRSSYLFLLRNTEEGWKAYREVASSYLPPSLKKQ